MKKRSTAPLKIAKFGYTTISVILLAVGIIFITVPALTVKTIGVIAGITMLVFGILKLAGGVSGDAYRAFRFDREAGILMIIIGAIILLNPEGLMTFICVIIGISVLVDGICKIRTAMDSKTLGVKSWWVVLVFAVVTILVGITLVFDSARSAQLLTVFLGISLASEGILNLITVFATAKIMKDRVPDEIDAEGTEVQNDKSSLK